MIGRLRGLLAEIDTEELILDVMGVGYIVRCGSRTLSRLPALGDELTLLIESQTREDGTRLFGFLSREDKAAFTQLQAIQGVGPKAALAVLDVLPPDDLLDPRLLPPPLFVFGSGSFCGEALSPLHTYNIGCSTCGSKRVRRSSE